MAQSYLPMSKGLVTCSKAAEILSVSAETVRRWFHAGTLEGVRLNGGNTIRIKAESLNTLLSDTAEGGAK
jgi:excisionase family DNA binding protein